jgi:hypothetical protein
MGKLLIARFTDPAAWRGLFLVATAYGINLAPEQMAAVAAFGMALAGALGLMPDHFDFKDYFAKAFGQASTWRGLVMIATAWGVCVSPGQAVAITNVGIALAGALGLMPDKFEFKDYLSKALGQASTWRGLCLLGAAYGMQVNPEQGAAIMAFGLALSGGVGVAGGPVVSVKRVRGG